MSNKRNTFSLSFPSELTLKVTGNFDFDPNEIQTLSSTYLPGSSIITDDSIPPNIEVEYHESLRKDLVISDNKIEIFDNWQRKVSLDLWHLLYSILRRELFSRNLYSVHASCLGVSNHLLLFGHTGAGKTTVSMRLLNDFPDIKLFSGNKTVVSLDENLVAVAGTRSVSIKSDDQVKYPGLISSATHFSDRSAFTLSENKYESLSKVLIKGICLVRIDDGLNQTLSINYPSSLHTLYPFFTDSVYADTVMCDGQKVFSGEIPQPSKDKLSQQLSKILKTSQVFSIRGSVKYIVDQTQKLL